MDFNDSVKFIFRDPAWIKKLLLLFLFSMLGITVPAASGYLLEVSRQVRRNGSDALLPEWGDFGTYYIDGLRFLLGTIFYALPAIMMGVATVIAALACAQLCDADTGLVWVWVMVILGGGLTMLCMLFLAFVNPGVAIMAMDDPSWSFAFNLSRLRRLVFMDCKNFLIVMLLVAAFNAFAQLGTSLLVVGIMFTAPWASLATANLWGQLARRSDSLL